MPKHDITLLTSSKFLAAEPGDTFVENLLLEDRLLTEVFQKYGLKVTRTNWDNPEFKWSDTAYVIIRTPWDYFSRYDEFSKWFEETAKVTKFINSYDIIKWNIDKHYMLELKSAGINIPETIFIEPGDKRRLRELMDTVSWEKFILKPAISGGAWHTYMFTPGDAGKYEEIYNEMVKNKCMLLQEYQESIKTKGEVSYVVIGGKFTHAILKKGKDEEFRVQESFGGTVHDYKPSEEEIEFAQNVVSNAMPGIVYARVDIMRDNNDMHTLGELEVFEPELWFRKNPPAADIFAGIIAEILRASI